MKTLFVILAGIIFLHSSVHSQIKLSIKDNSEGEDFFSMSYELGYGIMSNSEIMNGGQKYGHIGGIELALHGRSLNEFFISYDFQKFINTDAGNPLTMSYLSTGPRIRLSQDRAYFIEGAVVTYFLNGSKYVYYFGDPYGSYNFHRSTYMGFSFGFGKEIEFTKSVLAALSVRFNGIFAPRGPVFSCGLFSRFTFNTKDAPLKKTNDGSSNERWAFTLLGGVNNPDFFVNRTFKWGPSYGLEAALKTSQKMETTLTLLNERFEFIYPYLYDAFNLSSRQDDHNALEILAGERVFLNRDAVSSFLNLGGGIYTSYPTGGNTPGHKNYSDSYFGVYFGTGALFHIYKSLSIDLGSKLNILFTGKYSMDSHLNVLSGIRIGL